MNKTKFLLHPPLFGYVNSRKSYRVDLTMTKNCHVFSISYCCQYLSSVLKLFESILR